MGLDQYLHRKYYVRNWDHMKPEERHSITILQGGKSTAIPVEKISAVTVLEMQWRKANAIHNWFVQNVLGCDECQEAAVSVEQLRELLATVNEVLAMSIVADGIVRNGATMKAGADHFVDNIEDGQIIVNPETAKELLPTTSGFFFGSTDYDQWYVDDLKYTQQELTRILNSADIDSADFTYHASW